MFVCLFVQTSHKRTFLYLEQMILKHRLHTSALRIKETHEGLDLFYATKQEARKLVDFITSSVPSKYELYIYIYIYLYNCTCIYFIQIEDLSGTGFS